MGIYRSTIRHQRSKPLIWIKWQGKACDLWTCIPPLLFVLPPAIVSLPEYCLANRLKKGVLELWSIDDSRQKKRSPKLLHEWLSNCRSRKGYLGLDWQLKTPYHENHLIKNDWGRLPIIKKKSSIFPKIPSKALLVKVLITAIFFLLLSIFHPMSIWKTKNSPNPSIPLPMGVTWRVTKTHDFWRPGPMAEGFDFYEVLPNFINKAKAFIDKAQKKRLHFSFTSFGSTPYSLGAQSNCSLSV